MYLNDIQNAVDECGIKLYADDTVLYQSGINCAETEIKLQHSVSKTKTTAFASRSKVKKCKNLDVHINGVSST